MSIKFVMEFEPTSKGRFGAEEAIIEDLNGVIHDIMNGDEFVSNRTYSVISADGEIVGWYRLDEEVA